MISPVAEAAAFGRTAQSEVKTAIGRDDILTYLNTTSDPASPDNYISELANSLDKAIGFDFSKTIDESMKAAKETAGADVTGVGKILSSTGLTVSAAMADGLSNYLKHEFNIASTACCIIKALVTLDNVDRADVVAYAGGNPKHVRRTLAVLRSLLKMTRATLRRGVINRLLGFSLNFMKIIIDTLYGMLTGLFAALATQFKQVIVSKLGDTLRRNTGRIIECLGFLRIIQFSLDALISDFGIFVKMRTFLTAWLNKLSSEAYSHTKELQTLSMLRWLDILIKILDSLIYAIDQWEICTPATGSMDSTRAANAGSSEESPQESDSGLSDSTNSDITTSRANATNQATFDYDEVSLSAIGRQNITSGKGTTSYGVPVVDATRLLSNPTAEDLEKFLTTGLGVPAAQARIAAIAGATGQCPDRLTETEAARVQSILKNIGL